MTSTALYRKLRRIVVNLLGGECENCGRDLTGEIEFAHIHHVDGDHENDSTTNIQLLCKQCHTEEHKAPTDELD